MSKTDTCTDCPHYSQVSLVNDVISPHGVGVSQFHCQDLLLKKWYSGCFGCLRDTAVRVQQLHCRSVQVKTPAVGLDTGLWEGEGGRVMCGVGVQCGRGVH